MQFFAGFSLFVFILVSALLILLVLVQNDQGEGLGGLFSGSSSSPFGGQGVNVLQRITGMLALLFFVSAIGHGLTTRARYSLDTGIDTSFQSDEVGSSPWWSEQGVIPATEVEAGSTEIVQPTIK